MKKLPIGIQTFEDIVTDNYIYVDRTKEIYTMLTSGKCFFLSRPRRFGKSLLCSTLKSLFEAKKDLFKGLWIEKSDWKWVEYPVISIPMARVPMRSEKDLEDGLSRLMNLLAEQAGCALDQSLKPGEKLAQLIELLSKKNKVAVIIDEYDHALVAHIDKPDVAIKLRNILRDFYKVLKELDSKLHFVLITGVSKFSKASIFSGLNNLHDITINQELSSITGYTRQDIEDFFADRLALIARENNTTVKELVDKITQWYDGYMFHQKGIRMYNPFSVLNYMSTGEFRNYWFETGTPTFLIDLIEKNNYPVLSLDNIRCDSDEMSAFDVDYINLQTILFQTGYLTIKGFDSNLLTYTLAFPNYEVKSSLLKHLMYRMTRYRRGNIVVMVDHFKRALAAHDLKEFFRLMNVFLANIPYTIQIKAEKYYQSVFFIILKLMDADIAAEDATNIGRIAIVYETDSHVYVIEFKINKSSQEAIRQIEEKRYYEKFLGKNKQIVLIGINFDSKKKCISPQPIIKVL